MSRIPTCDRFVKKIMPIIFVVGTPGNMVGNSISCVNEQLGLTVNAIKTLTRRSVDFDIQIGILRFSTDSEWRTIDEAGEPALLRVDATTWKDFDCGGLNDVGLAIAELDKAMTLEALFCEQVGYVSPLVIFVDTGSPSDNWEPALDDALKNQWFRYSYRLCFYVDKDTDLNVLAHIGSHYSGKPDYGVVFPVEDMRIVVEKLLSWRSWAHSEHNNDAYLRWQDSIGKLMVGPFNTYYDKQT